MRSMAAMHAQQIEDAGQRIKDAFEAMSKIGKDPNSGKTNSDKLEACQKTIMVEAMSLLLNFANDASRIAYALEDIALNTRPR